MIDQSIAPPQPKPPPMMQPPPAGFGLNGCVACVAPVASESLFGKLSALNHIWTASFAYVDKLIALAVGKH